MAAFMHIHSLLVGQTCSKWGGCWRGSGRAPGGRPSQPACPAHPPTHHCHCLVGWMQVVVGRIGDQLLTSEAGEVTSHLQGMFFRTARMLEAGMKPV